MAERLTPAQRRVVNTPGVFLVGVDQRGRPVVTGKRGAWGDVGAWALKRDGDPMDVAWPVEVVDGGRFLCTEQDAIRKHHHMLARARHPHSQAQNRAN